MPTRIGLDYRRFGGYRGPHITERHDFNDLRARRTLEQKHQLLMDGTDEKLKDGPVVMTGWKTESPFISTGELERIQAAAQKLAREIDIFWSIGIGGSYLGLRATIEAIQGRLELFNLLPRAERQDVPQIFFLGQNMDPNYTATVLALMKGKRIGGNVISKSGGTVEPAIAFAIIKKSMEESYSPDAAAERIIAITDAKKGALRKLAEEKGYKTFNVPDNVGGRFSVTSPVGLFTLAVAGVDIKEFIAGARYAEEDVRNQSFDQNIAMLRAAMRFLAHKNMGKVTEIVSTGIANLRGVTDWIVQLLAESEGKNQEGLWVSPEYYTEMAHANGQFIQQGPRNLIETFIMVENPGVDVTIPGKGTPVEYFDGRTLHFANAAFVEGLRDAHYAAGVPTMSYLLPGLDAFTLGMFYQYEMNVVALSGLLLGQNPFIQPGVQQYKTIADTRSGKPGTETAAAAMRAEEAKLDPRFII